MGGVFSKPKAPTPQPVPEIPKLADAQEVGTESTKDDLRKRRGRAANILSTGDDMGGTAQTQAKQLLG